MGRFREAEAEVDTKRQGCLASLDVREIKGTTVDALESLQRALGLGDTFGMIEIPAAYMPKGSFQKPSRRQFDLRKEAGGNVQALATLVRTILLRYLVPIGNTTKPCSISTLSLSIGRLRLLFRAALRTPSNDASVLWGRLSEEQMYELVPRTGKGDIGRLFQTLELRGLLEDVVRAGAARSRRGEAARKGKGKPISILRKDAVFVALPDEFVGECGARVAWVTRVLGPAVLDALEDVLESCTFRDDVGADQARKSFRQDAKRRLQSYRWPVDLAGNEPLKFELDLRTQDGKGGLGSSTTPLSWPPRTVPDLWQVISLVQSSHAFVVGLSGGPREGEILSQLQTCIVSELHPPRTEGVTYKLVFKEDGEERDWPAPRLTVDAMLSQRRIAVLTQRFAKLVGFDNVGNNIWVQLPIKEIGKSGLPLNALEPGLKKLIDAFGLQRLLVGSTSRERNLHPHRLRKTTARIVGLSLTNSVQVLSDLFGHENVEQTMAYLLSNKDIAEEARAVAQAQTIMFARDALEDVVGEAAGGRAAKRVKNEIDRVAKLRGVSVLDAGSIDQLAAELTEGGQYWELVRPGVICTKVPGQFGACNMRRGDPDVSNCRSSCDYRLEMASERANTDATIERVLVHIERAVQAGEQLAEEHWRGQLVANLFRFKECFERWSTNPLVVQELERRGLKGW